MNSSLRVRFRPRFFPMFVVAFIAELAYFLRVTKRIFFTPSSFRHALDCCRQGWGRRRGWCRRVICTYVDFEPRLGLVLAFSRDRTDNEAPMTTIAKRDRGVSSKRPRRRVGTPRSTPRHRHRDSDRRGESWANTRCHPTVRASRQCNRSKFRRRISIAAFCLTFEAKPAAASRPCFYRNNKLL